ncbi:MAG: malate dehydrogenase (oxaloacetate-decarboxylating)(NADP+), partial [Gammaproteobacteria bacterium]
MTRKRQISNGTPITFTAGRCPVPGKIEVVPTKPLANQRDLALAYSPGVAAPCELIVADPDEAFNVTARA